ncbi:MAG: fluoride efflux transporter CrcB [Flavobacteriaceae bacterium]|nr:MAG: fluoride efflux transporter CrcB [Flavobacteriaceae bacterium]
MKQFLLIFIGGGFGSMARYALGKWLNGNNPIPYGTMLANVLGCFIIGLVMGYILKSTSSHQNLALLIGTGFCGGFTTFSTFAFENQTFLKNGDFVSFFTYAFGSILLGFCAVFLGVFLVRFLN